MEQDLSNLKKTSGDANNIIDQMDSQIRRANEQLDELKQDRDHLEQALNQGERDKKSLSQKLNEVEEQIEQLSSESQRLEKVKKGKEEELSDAQLNTGDKDVLDELENTIHKLEAELNEASLALDKETDYHNKLENDKKGLARTLEELRGELEENESKISDGEKYIKKLSSDLSEAADKNLKAEQQIKSQEKKK